MTGYRAITRARKIVFWVSAVLFILTWPLLVLYAFGIVISPSARQPVVETGVLRVESIPAGAKVALNGHETGKTTPTALERLRAGDYRLELRKAGYYPWQAQVGVDIQTVRRINSAVLVPRVPHFKLIPTAQYSDEQISRSGQYLIFSDRTMEGLRIFDLKTGRYLSRAASLAPYLRDRIEQVSSQPWGNIILVHVMHDSRPTVLVLHFGTFGVDLAHLASPSLFQGVDFAWSPTLSGAVYFLRQDSLWKVESWTAPKDQLLAHRVKSVGVVSNTLYYVDSAGDFGQVTAFGRKHVIFRLPPDVSKSLVRGSTIRFAAEGWAAVLNQDGRLVIFDATGASEYSGIRGLAADRSRERFLVWSDHRIGSLPFPPTQPAAKKDSIAWFEAPPGAGQISAVFPAAANSNCLFVSRGTVYVQPVLPGVSALPQRVLTLAPGERLEYSEPTGLVLVLDHQINELRTLRLVVHSLLPKLE